MTRNSKIEVSTRHGRFSARVRHGWFDVDGLTAVIIIIIIAAVRIAWVTAGIVIRLTGRAVVIVSPIAARFTMAILRWLLFRAAGLILAFRAFYVP